MSDWLTGKIAGQSKDFIDSALEHQNQLTKPPGSLGVLEDLAVTLCSLQKTITPQVNKVMIRVFAADHGVVAQGVSAFPQEVTVEMVRNFANGGAAISIMAESSGSDFAVVNVGTANQSPSSEKILQRPVAAGTQNFCNTKAMTAEELHKALSVGKEVAESIHSDGCELFIGGEMGIGNTTSASALASVILQQSPDQLVGSGTGVDDEGRARKIDAVTRGLELHRQHLTSPVDILQCLGGFEIAALTASYLRCAQLAIPSLVDGFICSVAALIAVKINPLCRQWLLFAHQSAEPGHVHVLSALDATPLLQLNMRLGEGSGAAAALPLIRLACDLHNRMATFTDAGVSNKS